MSKSHKKQLDEGNKIIALFDGWEIYMQGKKMLVGSKGRGYWGVLYDKDWSSLMDVVVKIQQEGYRFYVESNEEHTKVRFTDMAIPGKEIVSIKHFGGAKIAVWLAVVELLKCLNENI